jgi:hypothetical protein
MEEMMKNQNGVKKKVDQKAKARDMLEAERYASASDLVHVSVV